MGCFNSFITLPITFTGLVSNVIGSGPSFNFYQGWTFIHSSWEPVLVPNSIWASFKWSAFSVYWDEWVNPFFALVFFALFGLTPEAMKGYRNALRCLIRTFGVGQAESLKELPGMFEDRGVTNTTVTSNVSNRYCLSILIAVLHFLIASQCSTHADVLP